MKLIAPLLVVFLATSATAATRTWTGTNSGSWSDPANWGGTAPGAGDDLVFPNAAVNKTTNNDITALSVHSIAVSGSATYTLNGLGITLGSGGLTIATTAVFALPMNLSANQFWQVQSAGRNFIVNSVISGSGNVTIVGPEQVTITGTNTATGRLLYIGSGDATLDISGSTTKWPGSVQVDSNALELSQGATVGPIQVDSGGTFEPGVLAPAVAYSGDFAMDPGGTFSVPIVNQPTLFVQGNVSIANAKLVLGIGTVAAGTHIKVIDNDGSDPISGTFIGLPEGSTIAAPGGQPFTVSYVGGDGNDLVLTALAGGAPVPALDVRALAALAALLGIAGVFVTGRR